ncbi:DUF1565 domain-containing protein [Aerosakkonema funiforme]|uniref:DUF1565 domain-containing protein n=3 Tax=Oscillatoriophycideae TaxID=1301283 RepID=A0A926ZGP6_9CYAN|nr:DUF1565 domain-containing protein [Aerosakkonema funiforme]MBD2181779.1 DUF1565 domain-containing protein [Aerosakkonema funiforme FACHB-1375]
MNLKHSYPQRKNYSLKPIPTSISDKNKYSQLGTIATLGIAIALSPWVNTAAIAQLPIQRTSVELAQSTAQTTQLFVNPANGNDTAGNGSNGSPFKTITQALRVAQPNTTIILAPGTYSEESGETFPIILKPGVSIQGDPANKGRNAIIKGGGQFISRTFARQNIAILAADKSAIVGVTVTNSNRRGYGLWIEFSSPLVTDNTFIGNSHDGISVTGSSAPVIRNNYFADNGANGITIYNSSKPELRENVFERTGFGINIGHTATPMLVGNRITQNIDGVVVQNKAQPVLRGNTIEENSRDGVVAIGEARPDLGIAQQPGGNVFRNNRRLDINGKTSSQTIPAFGNQLAGGRISGRLDLSGTIVAAAPENVEPPPTAISTIIPNPTQTRSTNNFPSGSGGAVQIPVPPPLSSGEPVQVRQTIPNSRRPNTPTAIVPPPANQTEPVEITAPPPRSSDVSPSLPSFSSTREDNRGANFSTQPVRQSRGTLPDSGVEAGLLPVPGSEIPVSNSNNLPSVAISPDNPLPQESRYSPRPSSTSRAVALGLRYRVIVDVGSARQQRLLRSLVPGAFRTRSNGRAVMQVGAYSDRTEAEEMLQKLNSNGLNASIEELQL